jgi:transaldolase
MPADGGDCEEVLSRFQRAGIDVGALAALLQRDGALAFDRSWNDLMGCICSKSEAHRGAR